MCIRDRAQGVCDGTIAFAPMGEDGFGYDPIFFVPKLRKTFAQMTACLLYTSIDEILYI